MDKDFEIEIQPEKEELTSSVQLPVNFLSFGEIANIVGISRQAVLDGINKGEKHLCEYEEALGLVKKDKQINLLLDEVSLRCDDEGKAVVEKIKKLLED